MLAVATRSPLIRRSTPRQRRPLPARKGSTVPHQRNSHDPAHRAPCTRTAIPRRILACGGRVHYSAEDTGAHPRVHRVARIAVHPARARPSRDALSPTAPCRIDDGTSTYRGGGSLAYAPRTIRRHLSLAALRTLHTQGRPPMYSVSAHSQSPHVHRTTPRERRHLPRQMGEIRSCTPQA